MVNADENVAKYLGLASLVARGFPLVFLSWLDRLLPDTRRQLPPSLWFSVLILKSRQSLPRLPLKEPGGGEINLGMDKAHGRQQTACC